MFEKHGINTMRDFSESMYCQYGVRVAILAGYCNTDGEPVIMLYISKSIYLQSNNLLPSHINNELGGTSFKSVEFVGPQQPNGETAQWGNMPQRGNGPKGKVWVHTRK